VNRLDEKFAQGKVLVTYLCAGDPDLPASQRHFQTLVDSGADVIEIGVPFSDPGADGPAIQLASERALAAGTTLTGVLEMAGALTGGAAKVLFGYLNPFLAYGYERLAKDCEAAGIDGVLCVDCPPEEEPEFRDALKARRIHTIVLMAPTTPDDRVVGLAPMAGGFVYYVSMTGVTGAAFSGDDALVARVARLRELTELPVAVGFGIRTPEDAALVAQTADGVVVGSALVRLVARDGADAGPALAELTSALREAF